MSARTAILLAAAGCLTPPPALAQSAQVVSEGGLHRAVFRLPAGTIRLNLPGDLTAGDHVVGTVYSEPSGRNRQEQDRNARLLTGYALDVEGPVGFEGNRMAWSVPANLTPQAGLLRLRDRARKVVAECRLPLLPGPAAPPGFVPQPALDLPTGGTAGGFVSVWGTFPATGAASARIGNQPAEFIAQSPRKAVFLAPLASAGSSTIEVTAGPISARGPFWGLGLVVTASSRELLRGQTAVVTVTVSGLSGLTGVAHLWVTDRTPAIAAMEGGAGQHFTIAGADVRPDGTYVVERRLVAQQDGTFDISAVATRPPFSQLPVDGLARRAIALWSSRNGIEIGDAARDRMLAGVAEAGPMLDEFLMAQMAWGANPGDLLSALVAEYCFDLRNRMPRPAVPTIGRERPAAPPRFALGFQAAPPKAATIDVNAVQNRTFLQFLGDLLRRLTPNGGWGSILVTSQPPQQPFLIDQSAGITVQTFSATAGPHSVKVGTCQRQVQVVPNQTTLVECTLK